MQIAYDDFKLLSEWEEKKKNSLEIDDFANSSWESPDIFWGELHQNFGNTSPNFYQDCVMRHLSRNNVAFKWYEGGEWRECTYTYLHRLVNYQVSRWRNQHQDWKKAIAIVMPLGLNYLVALLATIRLGLRFTVFPLDSPLLPRKRLRTFLDQLNVEMILTTPEASPEIGGNERHWLIEYLEESEKYEPENDSVYQPDDPVQLAYSCHAQNTHLLVPISAREMYQNALRDGYFIFGLSPGMIWGYCPDCSIRELPHLLLTSLLFGATTVIFPEKEIRENPKFVAREPVNVLGVTSFLRDLWATQEGMPKNKLNHWYHNIFDEDQKSWDVFVKKNKLENLPFKRLLIDNAACGVPLSSFPVEDEVMDPLWPAFGVNWDLLQWGLQDVSSIHSSGVLKGQTLSEIATNFFVTKQRVGFELVTSVSPQKRGYTIPIEELESFVEQLTFVDFAFSLTLPEPHSRLRKRLILVVFINPALSEKVPSYQNEWESKIKEEISNQLSSLFLPDKIEFFPLVPLIKGGKLDRSWCNHQYTHGILHRKKELRAYHWLSHLKRAVLDVI